MREGGGGVGRIGREREGGRLHPPISNPLRGDVTAAVSKGTQREQPVRIPGRSISAAGLHSQLTAHTRRTRWEREKNFSKMGKCPTLYPLNPTRISDIRLTAELQNFKV